MRHRHKSELYIYQKTPTTAVSITNVSEVAQACPERKRPNPVAGFLAYTVALTGGLMSFVGVIGSVA